MELVAPSKRRSASSIPAASDDSWSAEEIIGICSRLTYTTARMSISAKAGGSASHSMMKGAVHAGGSPPISSPDRASLSQSARKAGFLRPRR